MTRAALRFFQSETLFPVGLRRINLESDTFRGQVDMPIFRYFAPRELDAGLVLAFNAG